MRLSASELSIGYRNHLVGSGVDLARTAGEVLVLLGQNGAGETTLFRALLGLNPALGGAVLLDDKVIDRVRPAEIARRRAYVPAAGARARILLHGARRRADGPHHAARHILESRRKGRGDRARWLGYLRTLPASMRLRASPYTIKVHLGPGAYISRCAADRAPHQPGVGKRDQLRARCRELPPRATKRTSPSECDHHDSGVRGPGLDDQSCLPFLREG
jgi:hypothetical protein